MERWNLVETVMMRMGVKDQVKRAAQQVGLMAFLKNAWRIHQSCVCLEPYDLLISLVVMCLNRHSNRN